MTPPTTPARVAGERLLKLNRDASSERYVLEEDLSVVSASELFSITDELLALRAKLEAARPALEAGANSLLVEQARFEERARRQNNSADRRLAELVGAQAAVLRSLSEVKP